MTDYSDVGEKVYDAIIQTVDSVLNSGLNARARAEALRHLAEAAAWVVAPAQAHGGSSTDT